jgi:hypothetical protein
VLAAPALCGNNQVNPPPLPAGAAAQKGGKG